MDEPLDIYEFAKIEELRSELKRVSSRLRKEKEERVDIEEAIRLAARASFASYDPPKVAAPKKDRRSKDEEVAVAFGTDWHIGAKHGTEFNTQVAEERVIRYANKILSIAEVQRADHPVKECRVWMLGDMVTGETIFGGQAHEIDAPLIDQLVTDGLRICEAFLVRLLSGFETVSVVGMPGNHGRLGPFKGAGVYHPESNADTILYSVVRERFRAEPRVSFKIPRGKDSRVYVDSIGKYKCLLTHGDLFRGGNSFAGLPFYQFANKALKWRDQSVEGQMDRFKDVACGHWHRCASIPVGSIQVRLSGTLQTYDPFSRETLAALTVPQQMLMFVHPQRGIVTGEYQVRLD